MTWISRLELEDRMKYSEFRDLIRRELEQRPDGITWNDLRDRLALPYDRPCPTWVKQLEDEVGLVRAKGSGRAYLWKLG
jgi:hypothetical protein